MDKKDILRFLKGQLKKHGPHFSVQLKYVTDKKKIRKRHGDFIELIEDSELVLFSPEKKSTGHYQIDRIVEISKL